MEKNNTQTGYRPYIDGLRGFSILFVIIFHAFPELLPGGFLGVDIFFVISGYLITRILLKIFESVVSQHSNTAFLNIESLFCKEISCSMRFGEIFLYRDRHHLSVEGSWLAGGEVARKLKSLGWVN